jgi:hypothetical protein
MDLLCSLCGQEGPVALQKQPKESELTVPTEEEPDALVRPDDRVAEGKEAQDTDLICYCFGHTRRDIEQDFIKNNRSLILEKISSEKKAGGCDCAAKNPKGR